MYVALPVGMGSPFAVFPSGPSLGASKPGLREPRMAGVAIRSVAAKRIGPKPLSKVCGLSDG